MPAGIHLSMPAVAAILAGVILLAIAWWGWPFQNYPGAKTWTLILVTVAVWDIAYGISLTVFIPEYRWWFEIPILFGRTASIPLIFLFVLQYTGREDLARSKWMYGVFGMFGFAFLVAITNPAHQLMWSDYHISPVIGAAAVQFTPRFYYIVAGISYMFIIISIVLFSDTFARYRSVYGRQVIALIAALIIPSVANILWMFRLGPTQHLDLTPFGHIVAGTLVTYALFQEEMFEIVPASRHMAEQVILENLGSAVISVTKDGRILNSNRRGLELIRATEEQVLLEPVESLLDIKIPPEESASRLSNPFGRQNDYTVEISEIKNKGQDTIGYTILLKDITTERLRQQRLGVLNRILRHNLRNDLNTVELSLSGLEEDLDGPTEETKLMRRKINALIDIGNKARSLERIIASEETTVTGVKEVIYRSVNELNYDGDCSIEIGDIDGDAQINASLVTLILQELVENGCMHNYADKPIVRIDAMVDGSQPHPVTITVTDNGFGIPEHEIAPLQEGVETSLQHGSGFGLWLVKWGVSLLNGQVEFEDNDPRGTVVTVKIPTEE